MKVLTKLVITLSCITAVIMCGLLLMQRFNLHRTQKLVQMQINEMNTLYDKILKLETASLETFVYDLSHAEATVFCLRTGDTQKVDLHVAPLLDSFNVQALWLLRPDLSCVYHHATSDAPELNELPIEQEELRTALSHRPFKSFYAQTPLGYMQLKIAPVQQADDTERKRPPLGYFVAGRLWTEDYIEELSVLTESTLQVGPPRRTICADTTRPEPTGEICFSRPMQALDQKTLIAQIEVRGRMPFVAESTTSFNMLLLINLLCSAFIVLVLVLFAQVILRKPLRTISRSLTTWDPALLRPLENSESEFGDIARLMLTSFRQQVELAREIDERRAAQDGLQRFRFIVENAGQEVYLINHDGSFEYVNRAAAASLKHTVDELLALGIVGIDPDYGHLFREHFEQLKRQDLPAFETVHTAKDGMTIVKEMKSCFISFGGREFVCAFGRDITDRKQAEQQVKQARDFLENVFRMSPESIIVTDPAGQILMANDSARTLFGYDISELIGRHGSMFLPDSEQHTADTIKLMKSLLTQRMFKNHEVVLKCKDGSLCRAEMSATLLRDDNGTPAFAIATVRDVSERRDMETRLRQAQKMEAIGTLAGGIAHDFNNILGAIIGYTELTQIELPPESPLWKNLGHVLESSMRARDLVSQILAFSRKSELDRKPLHLHHIVKEALKLLRASLPSTISIVDNTSAQGDTIFADPTQMHQVLMNLCTNAGHAMQARGGVLEVTISRIELDAIAVRTYIDITPGAYVRLSVRDTGQGMPPNILGRIFDPFFTTKEKGKGTGMGLSVVHGIVKNHGGAIKAYSEPGIGTTFHVLFPAIDEHIGTIEKTPESVPSGRESILIVDDEELLMDISRQMLASVGYQVTGMASSVAALELFRRNPERFDLLITDQTMPLLTGYELAQQVLQLRPGLPIILCTGYSETVSEECARTSGFAAFLLKPLDFVMLSRTVRAVLDGAQQPA